MRISTPAMLTTMSLALLGCQQDAYNDLRKDVKSQAEELAVLQTQVAALALRVDRVAEDVRIDTLGRDFARMAYLTPGDEGYSTIQYDLGYMTVKIEDIRAFANGSKVTLQFGNVQSAAINGLKGKIEWGSTNKDGIPDNANASSKEFSISKSLPAGSWSKVTITLDGTPPDKLGFVRVRELSHTGIRLFTP